MKKIICLHTQPVSKIKIKYIFILGLGLIKQQLFINQVYLEIKCKSKNIAWQLKNLLSTKLIKVSKSITFLEMIQHTFKFSTNSFVLENVANCVADPHVTRAIAALAPLHKARGPCSDITHLKASTIP